MSKNSEIQVAKAVVGEVEVSNFKEVDCEMPVAGEGQIVVKALHISVDPYLRGVLRSTKVGEVITAGQAAEVIESKSEEYKVGEVVCDYLPWRRFSLIDVSKPSGTRRKLSDALPYSTCLGVGGMPGLTAYVGLMKIGDLKDTDQTVVVSGAAGAVGSTVGQIAKLKGKRVVGVAGGATKCEMLMKEFGFDAVIDYKGHSTKESMRAAFKEACPDGVDVYFENTGGMATECVFEICNKFARVAVCGQISMYNDIEPKESSALLSQTIYKNMIVRGFMVYDACGQFPGSMEEYFGALPGWIKDGKIKYKETFSEGFESIPTAFCGLFKGANTGKMVVNC